MLIVLVPNELVNVDVASIFGNTWVFLKEQLDWSCGTKRKLLTLIRRCHYDIKDVTDFSDAEVSTAFEMAKAVTKSLDIENVKSYGILSY